MSDIANMTQEQIEQELESLSTEIDKLYERQTALTTKLSEMEDHKVDTTNKILGVGVGVTVVSFARDLDYHIELVSAYTITGENKFGFDAIVHQYRFDDYEYSYRVTKSHIGKNTFHNLTDRYNLYSLTDSETLEELFKDFNTLSIETNSNFRYLESVIICPVAKGSIKFRQ